MSRQYNTLTPAGDARQRLNRIEFSCTIPRATISQGLSINACDVYNHCAAALPSTNYVYYGGPNGIHRKPIPAAPRPGYSSEAVSGMIAVDAAHKQLYWTTSNAIRRANTDGTQIATVIGNLSSPRGLALDTRSNKLYWSESNRIARANLDGLSIEALIGTGGVSSIALDLPRGKLFYNTSSRVYSANLDGSGITTVAPPPTCLQHTLSDSGRRAFPAR